MNPLIYIELGLAALRTVLGTLEAQKAGGSTPATIDQDIAIVQGAIDALMKVHGTPTTYEQLEGMRTQKLW